MKEDLKQRLNQVIPRLISDELLRNSGLGNEIGFYIFDYPPESELEVREYILFVLEQLPKKKPGLRAKHINLFQLLVEYLTSRGLLDRALKLQREKGDEAMYKALKGPLHEGKLAKVFIDEAQPQNHDLILMSGVGSAWPLLRSHTLLNNLHPVMQGIPLVVFYPGTYDGQGLRLFGKLDERNYYRAFRLVP
ncbi:MAG: DUF1788 domain-containing protein [Syntrophobacteraceae bacterium]|jgi:hypothetical protein